jgi:hypothetical protein
MPYKRKSIRRSATTKEAGHERGSSPMILEAEACQVEFRKKDFCILKMQRLNDGIKSESDNLPSNSIIEKPRKIILRNSFI